MELRVSSYFNSWDEFLIYDENLKKFIVSKLEFFNGSWYSIKGLKYKMISVKSLNTKELL